MRRCGIGFRILRLSVNVNGKFLVSVSEVWSVSGKRSERKFVFSCGIWSGSGSGRLRKYSLGLRNCRKSGRRRGCLFGSVL